MRQRPIRRHPHRFLRRLIQILLWQTQLLIVEAPCHGMVPQPVGPEIARVHRPTHPPEITLLLEFRQPVLIPFARILVRDGPVLTLGPRDAHEGVEHVALTDDEGGNVDEPVLPIRKAGTLVALALALDFQIEEVGDSESVLRPGARAQRLLPIVEEHDLALGDVEAVPVEPAAEAELVPEPAADADPGRFAELGDEIAVLRLVCIDHHVLAERLVSVVVAEFVGQDPGDSGRRGGFDEFGLLGWRGAGAHGDDEGVLTAERGGEGGVVVVFDFFDGEAGGDLGGGILTGNGGDFLVAGLLDGGDYVFAAPAGGLEGLLDEGFFWRKKRERWGKKRGGYLRQRLLYS